MSDINAVVERGRKKFGTGEFDSASAVFINSIPDPGAREQAIIALANDPSGEDVVMKKAHEMRARALARNGPKDDAREEKISRINPRSPMYDSMPDTDWNAAFDKTYSAPTKKRR